MVKKKKKYEGMILILICLWSLAPQKNTGDCYGIHHPFHKIITHPTINKKLGKPIKNTQTDIS